MKLKVTEGFEEGKGLPFYRCVLCGQVISPWDIQKVSGCPKCKGGRMKPTELSFWEKMIQIFKHPMIWKWGC